MESVSSVAVGSLSSLRLSDVRNTNSLQEQQKAMSAANDFEAVMMSQLLKQMRDSLQAETLFPGDSGDVFGGLFDLYMGQHMAKAKSLGITDMVKAYLETKQQSEARKTNEVRKPSTSANEHDSLSPVESPGAN